MLLLAHAPRSTKDIDIFWLDEDGLQRAYAPLRERVQIIKQRHNLDADWLNYLAQMLMYDEVVVPDGKLWKRFAHFMSMLHQGNTSLPSNRRRT